MHEKIEEPEVSNKTEQRKKVIRSCLLTSAIILGMVYFGKKIGFDLNSVREVFKKIPKPVFFVMAAFTSAQILIQGLRMKVILPKYFEIGLIDVLRTHLVGQAINYLLPARAGDFYKVHNLRARSNSQAFTFGHSVGSVFLADKLADLVAMLLMAVFYFHSAGLGFNPDETVPLLRNNQLILAAAFLAVTMFVCRRAIFEKLPILKNILSSAFNDVGFSQYLMAIGLTFMSVGFECASIRFILEALGYENTWMQILMVYLVLNLGIAIPITMANIGTYEASLAGGLAILNVPVNEGIAVATVHHIMQMCMIFIPALLWIVWDQLLNYRKR